MSEQNTITTPRTQLSRLVLGRGHPITIVIVLTLVGFATCWFSLQQVASFTQTPTRYMLQMEANTQGCDDVQLELTGSIASFDSSMLQFKLLDENDEPILVEDCRLKSITLRSNLELEPGNLQEESELIRVTGMNLHTLAEHTNEEILEDYSSYQQTFRATVVDGDLEIFDRSDTTGPSPTFSMHVEAHLHETGFRQSSIVYEVSFEEDWQPRWFTMFFKVPENVKTYFEIFGMHTDQELVTLEESLPSSSAEEANPESDVPEISYKTLDIDLTFWTDEVSVVRGSMSDSGSAESIDGTLRIGIENNDAESKRESGNVRYSAVLGIGIALIVEAFVILLALGVQYVAVKIGFVKAGRPDGQEAE